METEQTHHSFSQNQSKTLQAYINLTSPYFVPEVDLLVHLLNTIPFQIMAFVYQHKTGFFKKLFSSIEALK